MGACLRRASRVATVCGAVLFALLMALAFVSNGRAFDGGALRGGNPANFVFVGLTQVGTSPPVTVCS